ncbi:MAG TPA: hypothetical protein VMW91_02270 [Desulfosporosinus sp.]|nr:hypothetical protein [Desulfosporosinus sp.]
MQTDFILLYVFAIGGILWFSSPVVRSMAYLVEQVGYGGIQRGSD